MGESVQTIIRRETWLPVPPGLGPYEVSDFGRVRYVGPRRKQPHLLAVSYHHRNGYASVMLGGQRRVSLHRLVLTVFARLPKPGECCDHIDFDRRNNTLWNLRWTSPRENTRHSIEAGRINKRGTSHHGCKLTEDQVRAIRVAEGRQKDIAAAFGIQQMQVSRIKRGQRWGHLR